MDARLARAQEVEAAQKTAEAIVAVAERLDRIEAKLDQILAPAETPPPKTQPRGNAR